MEKFIPATDLGWPVTHTFYDAGFVWLIDAGTRMRTIYGKPVAGDRQLN